MFSFSQLQAAMPRLRFKDESALRSLGLVKLIKTFDAYPLTEDGVKIYVLLPRDMEPSVAQKLGAVVAAKSVIVLAQSGEAVAKLWPTEKAVADAISVPTKAPEPVAATMDFEIVEE